MRKNSAYRCDDCGNLIPPNTQHDCPKVRGAVTSMVHWPGKEVPSCDRHLKELMGLSEAMGFQVSWTPCTDGVCANCVREMRGMQP